MPHSESQEIPAWRGNLPLVVLSSLLIILGLILSLSLMNLPLPHTDPVVGDVRILLGVFVVACFGMGGAWLRLSLTGRLDPLYWVLQLFGFAGFIAAMALSITLHPSFQALPA